MNCDPFTHSATAATFTASPTPMDIDYDEDDNRCFVCGVERRTYGPSNTRVELTSCPLVGRTDSTLCARYKASGVLPPNFHLGMSNRDNWLPLCLNCSNVFSPHDPSAYIVPTDIRRYIEADLTDREQRLCALAQGDSKPRTMPAESADGCEVMMYVNLHWNCDKWGWCLLARQAEFPKVYRRYAPALLVKAIGHQLPLPGSDELVTAAGAVVPFGVPATVLRDLHALQAVWMYSGLEYTEILYDMWSQGFLGYHNDSRLKKRKHPG